MKLMQTAFLLVAFVAGSSVAMQYYQTRVLTGGGSCDSHTCGINARCTISEGRPVCSCNNLHMGDPLTRCERVECLINDDCLGSQTCQSNRCINPCSTVCGTNALCNTVNHVPTCSCPPGYSGDPFNNCIYDPQAPCKTPNVCGANTKCEVINGVATCSCLPGYRGHAIQGCRHECESDYDCPSHMSCTSSFRCENPCSTACGQDAECEVNNHRAKCSCPKNWLGNPLISCRPECTSNSECPAGKPACIYQKCINPCDGACGTGANCEIKYDGITPICSCPKDKTGDPFTHCHDFPIDYLCNPNPCGVNAECRPGHDRSGKERPVCTCPRGYIGNALVECKRGECQSDNECPDNKACIDFACQNPCAVQVHACGANASCTPRRHIAVCTCNDGYRGDAIYRCDLIDRSARYGFGKYLRY